MHEHSFSQSKQNRRTITRAGTIYCKEHLQLQNEKGWNKIEDRKVPTDLHVGPLKWRTKFESTHMETLTIFTKHQNSRFWGKHVLLKGLNVYLQNGNKNGELGLECLRMLFCTKHTFSINIIIRASKIGN